MFKSKLLWTGALAGLGLATAAAYAEPTQQDLMQKINDLQAQVAQLQSTQSAQQHQLDARDVDATVNSVLNDADSHSMLVDGAGVTAGWDKASMGFFIQAEDGSSKLHPGFVSQFRYGANWTDGADRHGGQTALQNGFEQARLKLYVDGNLISKDLTFKIQYANGKTTGALTLDDVFAQYVFAHNVVGTADLGIKAGQFKDPVVKEENMPDQGGLCVERSLLNGVLGGGLIGSRVQGVGLVLVGSSPVRAGLFFDDGGKSVNTDISHPTFTSTVLPVGFAPVVNWGAAARVDVKLMGDWNDTKQFTAKGNKADLLVAGAGANMTEFDNGYLSIYTADVQFNTLNGKLSLYGAVVGSVLDVRNYTTNDGRFNVQKLGSGSNLDNYGFVVQAGYLVTDALEVFGRYDWTRIDPIVGAGLSMPSAQAYNEVTAGVNYYLGENGSWGTHAKITLDVVYLPQGSPAAYSDADIMAQTNHQVEVVARAQFTLWI